MKHLLIVYHSKTGNTAKMAAAVLAGTKHSDINDVETRMLTAAAAGPDDLRWADALLLGTPENFGYMSGMMKDFLDRTYYEVEGKLQPLPYAIFISAGNDGTGAVTAIQRIAKGYPFVEVHPPLIANHALTEQHLASCQELGTTLAAGLEAGIY